MSDIWMMHQWEPVTQSPKGKSEWRRGRKEGQGLVGHCRGTLVLKKESESRERADSSQVSMQM